MLVDLLIGVCSGLFSTSTDKLKLVKSFPKVDRKILNLSSRTFCFQILGTKF